MSDLWMDPRHLWLAMAFGGLGFITAAVTFTAIVHWLLKSHRDEVIGHLEAAKRYPQEVARQYQSVTTAIRNHETRIAVLERKAAKPT